MAPHNSARPARSQLLDWFRGLGITAVVWGHAGLPGLPGAYLLIDCFFVISGFLVTRSFVGMQSRGADASQTVMSVLRLISAFYQNRIRRIVIPLATVTLLTLGAGWLLLLPDDLLALAASARAVLFLQAHLYGLSLGDYFDTVAQQAPMLHAWSLSLEEQFYIFTPFFILPVLLWKRWCGLAALIGFAAMSLWTAESISQDPDALGSSYYLFATRIWEYLVGVLLALFITSRPKMRPVLNDTIIATGLGIVFLSVLFLTNKAPSPGLITLPVVFGVMVVLMLRPQTAILKRICAVPVCSFVGLRLYSIYLAHYPVIIYFDYAALDFGAATNGIKFGLAMGSGLGCYYLLEAPKDGWKALRFRYVIGMSAILYAVTLLVTVTIQQQNGAPYRLPEAAQTEWNARFKINPYRARCIAGEITQFGYSCRIGTGDRPYIALFGDSHSDAIATALIAKFDQMGYDTHHYWYAECPVIGAGLAQLAVFSTTCEKLSFAAHSNVLGDRNAAGVVYAMRWSWYLEPVNDENIRAYWRDTRGLPAGFERVSDFRQAFTSTLAASVQAFSQTGRPIYLVSPTPSFETDPVHRGALAAWYRSGTRESVRTPAIQTSDYMAQRRHFDQLYASLSNIGSLHLIELFDAFCDDRSCSPYGPQGSLFYDTNHLNVLGGSEILSLLTMKKEL